MSAIGDYIYFTTYGYEHGEEPFNGYKNKLSRNRAKNIFEKKRKEVMKGLKNPTNYVSKVRDFFNLATALTSNNKTINNAMLSPEESAFIKTFPEIFKEKLKKSNMGAQYTGLNTYDTSEIDKLISKSGINKNDLKLDKDLQLTGKQWIKRINEIYKLLSHEANGIQVQKWMAGSLGKKDVDRYVNDFKELSEILNNLDSYLLGNRKVLENKIKLLHSYDSSQKITNNEMDNLIKWLDVVNKSSKQNNENQNMVNFFLVSKTDENVFSQLRYFSHMFFTPSYQVQNALAEVFSAAVHETMYWVAMGTAKDKIFNAADIIGKQTSNLYVKKEDLSKELADKFYKQKDKKMEEVEIGGVKMIKLPNATQNKIDVLFKQPIANISNIPNITIGESVKRTNTSDPDKKIKFLTGGNIYNLIGNENDNLFLTHYINNFASQIQRKSKGIPQEFSNIHTREKDEISKTGDLAMKAIYAHHGLTGEGTLKYNDDGSPLAGATLLSWYNADSEDWKVYSIRSILNTLNKEDYKSLSIERKLYKSGNNDRIYTSNMFPIGVLPYKAEHFNNGEQKRSNANMGVVRRRINSILSYLHGSRITLALSHVQNWLK